MNKKNDRDVADSLAFIIERMATKSDLNDLEKRLSDRIDGVEKKLGDKVDGLDSKVAGTNRRLDIEAMQRTDLKLPRRVHELEEKTFGIGRSKHPKHVPLS